MKSKPLILITNDDGVFAPGIKALAEAAQDLGELLIVAPRYGQSGMGHSYPKYDDIGIIEEVYLDINGIKTKAYGVVGSPSSAVVYALKEICDRKPDLCLSGINNGENVGAFVTCSGTVGAAITSSIYKIPSIAFSLCWSGDSRDSDDYNISRYFSKLIVKKLLKDGFEEGVDFYNVNIPYYADENTEVKKTVQSNFYHFDFEQRHESGRDWKKPAKLLWKSVKTDEFETNSDIYTAFFEKKVSITPMSINLSVKK